jgi:hypothetical protein
MLNPEESNRTGARRCAPQARNEARQERSPAGFSVSGKGDDKAMSQEANGETMVAAEEAAKAMQTTVLSVMMHIKRRLLEGHEIDGAWYVSAASLATFLAHSGGATAPVVCRSGCSAKKGGCTSCG